MCGPEPHQRVVLDARREARGAHLVERLRRLVGQTRAGARAQEQLIRVVVGRHTLPRRSGYRALGLGLGLATCPQISFRNS